MRLGKYEINNIYNEDSYIAIKSIPDKSIDCIYVDIPYLYQQGGSGKSELGQRTAKKRLELMGVIDLPENTDYGLELKKAKKNKQLKSAKKKYIETNNESDRIKMNAIRTSIDYVSIEDGIDFSILNDFVRIMKKINIFIWCSKLQILDIMNYFIKEHNCLYEMIVWQKTNPTPQTNNSWLSDLEYCLYFREKGVPLNDGYELKSKWYSSPINKKDKDLFNHPTIKPLELVKRHLLHTTQPNDIVADFFLGSGTTAVACKETNRQYIGFELSKKWYDITVNRLNKVDASGQICLFLK